MAEVILKDIHKSFGAVEGIKGINLTVADGEFCVFVGPSGCGKSTLLRIISGLEAATSGRIDIDGRDVSPTEPSQRGIAMVFQSYALYPHLSVRDNIGFGLSLARRPKAEIAERVGAAALALQLTPDLDRKPKALSGGQRQRVAIGRAIERDPKVFLFDEPLSNLDAALRAQMRLELYNHPVSPFVAGFIGSPRMNLLQGAVAASMGCKTYGIRPEHLVLTGTAGTWQGRVRYVERLGPDAIVYLDTEAAGPLVARTAGETSLSPGDPVWATPIAERVPLRLKPH